MAQPSVGTTLSAGGFLDIHRPFVERGGAQAIFMRDNRGSATDMSPFESDCTTVKWSPFALDGQPRDDLLIRRRISGKYDYVSTPNDGWWGLGANTHDGGAEREPNSKSDDMMVLQSKFPVDSETTEKSYTVRFVAAMTADPLIHQLESELPLCDLNGEPLVPLPGEPDYFNGPTLDLEATAEYQIGLLYARRTSGGFVYRFEGYPAAKLDTQASKKRTKTDPDTADLKYKILPNEYFMRPDPLWDGTGTQKLVPGYFGVWFGGPGWDAQAVDGS
jgi:hypothetical protein